MATKEHKELKDLKRKRPSFVLSAFSRGKQAVQSFPAPWFLAISLSLFGPTPSDGQSEIDSSGKPKVWNLEYALEMYQNLSGKTVLRSELPVLPLQGFSGVSSNKTEAIARLESELTGRGAQLLQDGPHFVWIIPKNGSEILTNIPFRGAELAPPANQSLSNRVDLVPAGAINFPSTDLENVLPIYSVLRNRTVLRPAYLPSPQIHLKTACPLTRDEAIYAMTTVLALNGIAVVEDGEKFLQVMERNRLNKVKAAAPKATAADDLLNPERVPSLGESAKEPTKLPGRNSVNPGAEISREVSQARKLFFDFIHQQDPQTRYVDRLLSLYAGLTGKDALPCPAGGNLIRFSVHNPLTKKELLYAIETTFALNDFVVVPVGEKAIRLEHRR